MKNCEIKGIIPPILTPMNNDDSQTVNHAELRNQVERLLAGGVHGLFPFGTNGEGYILSLKEKEEVLETVIDQVKGRVPVYAGTGCITSPSCSITSPCVPATSCCPRLWRSWQRTWMSSWAPRIPAATGTT